MTKKFLQILAEWILILVIVVTSYVPAPRAQAITCGFGSDIGGGVCRGFITSGTSWTVPNDWNSANNKIECIGSGAGGASAFGIGGGGGGAYAASTNLTYTPTHSITVSVGVSGTPSTDPTNTFVKNDSNSANAVLAESAPGRSGIGSGGLAANSTGATKFNGGSGGGTADDGLGNQVGGGGGGAAGPNGAGNNGQAGYGNGGSAGNGGSGDAGSGGAGGTANQFSTGGNGGNGTEYDGSHGSGGGGGAGGPNSNGGDGGNYGGGGAGTGVGASPGVGKQGLIIITYTPATALGAAVARPSMLQFWGGFFRFQGGSVRIR